MNTSISKKKKKSKLDSENTTVPYSVINEVVKRTNQPLTHIEMNTKHVIQLNSNKVKMEEASLNYQKLSNNSLNTPKQAIYCHQTILAKNEAKKSLWDPIRNITERLPWSKLHTAVIDPTLQDPFQELMSRAIAALLGSKNIKINTEAFYFIISLAEECKSCFFLR